MKVYTVVIRAHGFNLSPEQPITTDDYEDAVRYAEELARGHPDEDIYLIEGTPIKSFHVPPAAVSVVSLAA